MLSDREAIEIRAILDLTAKGWSDEDLCRLLGCSERTLQRRRRKERALRKRRPSLCLARTPA